MKQGIHYHNNENKKNSSSFLAFFVLVLVFVFVGFELFLYIKGMAGKGDGSISGAQASSSQQVVAFGTLNYNFGMSLGDTLPFKSEAVLTEELADIASLGVGRIRIDVAWDDIQPENSTTYNWAAMDRIVAAANADHIEILGDIAYTPAWARPADCEDNDKCAPADPEQFAAFAKAVANRYAGYGLNEWEIWNEENTSGFWKPEPNAVAYVTLLKDTYQAIKSVEPSSTVITGGLAPSGSNGNGKIMPIDYLNEIYSDGAEPYFDAVGMHPYTSPTLPTTYFEWNAWSQMYLTSPSLRSVMDQYGDSKKSIWLTEFGAPTGGPGTLESSDSTHIFIGSPDHVTEALQSEIYSSAITSLGQLPWAAPLFFYSYKDLGTSTNTVENFFGVIRNDGTLKPAYFTIKKLLTGSPN